METSESLEAFRTWCLCQYSEEGAFVVYTHYVQKGIYPEAFLLYLVDMEEFEKKGYWPERNF